MIAHTIRAAIEARLAEQVYVCTEDDEIAAVAEAYGAVAFRIEASMAGDEVSSTVPCLALYDALTGQGLRSEFLFNLQPTSPLRNGDDIRRAFEVLTVSRADYLVSVTPVDPHYFQWVVVPGEGGWRMYFGDRFLKERTELPPVFRPNGAIKLGRAARVRQTGHFFGQPLAVLEMPEERSVHIATAFDLACARALAGAP